jgi:hypothetical protein
VVADRMADETGAVVGTAGYYIDLTATFLETRQVALDEALPDLFEVRALIEQAKGILMAIYLVSPSKPSVCCGGDLRKQTSSCVRWPNSSSPKSQRCHRRRRRCRVPSTIFC